jgi:predicted nuclease of predicted toxin-antitoxin system
VSVPLYADHHVPAPITEGVRLRGVNVLTTEEDGTQRMEDSALLDRATELGRVLFTQDQDFLAEAARRQRSGITFAGVIYPPQDEALLGRYVRDLEILCLVGDPEDFADRVNYLPL